MKYIRLTEKPSGTQVWLNMEVATWYYQITNDDGTATKIEFDRYNVLVQETPETVARLVDED